jgi:hypothetical protein
VGVAPVVGALQETLTLPDPGTLDTVVPVGALRVPVAAVALAEPVLVQNAHAVVPRRTTSAPTRVVSSKRRPLRRRALDTGRCGTERPAP